MNGTQNMHQMSSSSHSQEEHVSNNEEMATVSEPTQSKDDPTNDHTHTITEGEESGNNKFDNDDITKKEESTCTNEPINEGELT